MRLRRRLLSLLREEGFAAHAAVGEALDEFLAIVADENADATIEDDGEEEDGEDEDSEEDDAEGTDGEGDKADTDTDAVAKGDDAYAAGVRHIPCPHCGERIGLAIDLSGEGQDAIQDCEVCCSPIRVVYTVDAGKLASFLTEPA
ncbi:MAG: CPXCG motif-containing cysteine-rich protein [Planctomycetes bacterium]|nr:CPXCG motif-containing cysteine-rich protein [Planctomycetota bacterium]